jgi:hypothetical protein
MHAITPPEQVLLKVLWPLCITATEQRPLQALPTAAPEQVLLKLKSTSASVHHGYGATAAQALPTAAPLRLLWRYD